jgi:hypothetical protein
MSGFTELISLRQGKYCGVANTSQYLLLVKKRFPYLIPKRNYL